MPPMPHLARLLPLGLGLALSGPSAHAADGDSGASIPYRLDAEAQVCLVVEREDGWTVRQLITAERQAAGDHLARWDGRDDLGYPLPAGTYRWRLLFGEGLRLEYVNSVGNSGMPPWRTSDGTGTWGGNHGANTAVAADATGCYFGWVSAEGPPVVLKRNPDNTATLWGGHLGPFEGVLCLASDGDRLYGINNKRIIAFDRDTGKVIGSLKYDSGPGGPVQAPPEAMSAVPFSFRNRDKPPKGSSVVWGLAAGGGRLYVSLPWRDRIDVLDIGTQPDPKSTEGGIQVVFTPRPEEGLPLAKPAGLVLDGANGLYAISVAERNLVRFDLATKAATTVVGKGLIAPFGLGRLPDGTLAVTEVSPIHQIRTFSASGAEGPVFGRPGGPVRPGEGLPWSAYDPGAFWVPCAVAGDGGSGWWFVDDAFKRVGHLDARGALDWAGFGSVNYAATCALNPLDPTEVFTTMWHNTTFHFDPAKPGSFRPGRRLFPRWAAGEVGFPVPDGPHRLFANDGRLYLGATDRKAGAGPVDALFVVERDHLRPVARFWYRAPDPKEDGDRLMGLLRDAGLDGDLKKLVPLVWTDRNGDAAIQAGELVHRDPGSEAPTPNFDESAMTEDFTLVTPDARWPCRGVSGSGAPDWHPADIIPLRVQDIPGFSGLRTPAVFADGSTCAFTLSGDPGMPTGRGFWSGRSSGAAIIGQDPQGRPTWRVGGKARDVAEAGEMYYPTRTIGTLGDCAFFGDMEAVIHVVHRSGFYAQRLLQDPRSARGGPDRLMVENFSGHVTRIDGTDWLTISSGEATHVFRVHGADGFRSGGTGEVVLGSAEATASDRLLAYRTPKGVKSLRGGVLPQSGLQWPTEVPAVSIRGEKGVVGEIRCLADTAMLYVQVVDIGGGAPTVVRRKKDHTIADPLDGGRSVRLDFRGADGTLRSATLAMVGDDRIVAFEAIPSGWRELKNGKADWRALPSRSGGVWEFALPLSTFAPQPKKGAKAEEDPFADLGLPERNDGKAGGRHVHLAVRLQTRTDDGTIHETAWGLDAKGIASGSLRLLEEECPRGTATMAVAQRLDNAPKLDADVGDWPPSSGQPIGGAADDAEFRTAWDANNLYVWARTADPTPLRNTGEPPELLFKGGDALGIAFGAAKEAGLDFDQKLVLALVGKQPMAMLYRPRSAVSQPYTFTSPVSSSTFAEVRPANEVTASFRNTGTGWEAEVAIPWTLLGSTPPAEARLPFDVQIIRSDPTGTANATCSWWASRTAEAHANNDIPTEAKLYVREYGTLVLGTP